MIIKSILDAERAINDLSRQLDRLASAATASGLNENQVRALIAKASQTRVVNNTIVNTSNFDITDIDATPSEGQILHRLLHIFYEEVRFAKTIRLVDGWYWTSDGLRQWKTNIGFDNPLGGADPNYQIRWLDSVTPALNYNFFLDPTLGLTLNGNIIPLVNNTGDLGTSQFSWREGYFSGDLFQNAETTRRRFLTSFYGLGNANTVTIRRARGTLAAPTDVQIGDRLGAFVTQGWRGGAFANANFFDTYVNSLPSASTVHGDTYWSTTDSTGVNASRWNFEGNGHIVPFVNNAYDLGNSANRIRKLWAVDIDFSGTIAGTLPATDANTSLSANASATPTVTTTFADLSGATVTLNKNGTWLITANIVGSKELNDDEIQCQYVYDGTAVNGIIRIAASTATFVRSTGSRSWIQSVTGQPKVAKLQVKKNAGTGFSTVDATNSNITAVFLTT